MRDAPSLHATRAAVEDGVVPGGSVALIRAQRVLEKLEGSSEDQATGIKILVRSIEEPLRQIVANAGEHAATGVYGDMPEMGILDPTRVTRLALQNADPVTAWVTWACQVERPYRSMNETREATPGPLRLVG